MKQFKYTDMKGGWFIGDFSPSAYQTKRFEVSLKVHPKGEQWPAHYHEHLTEVNLLVRGRMTLQGKELNEGDIFVLEPGEIADPAFHEDCEIVCVKVPSVPGDKVEVGTDGKARGGSKGKDGKAASPVKVLAHRGNLSGPHPDKENHPGYLDKAISKGFDVEVDIRYVDGKWWLGHDVAQYDVTETWLRSRADRLWLHCKDEASAQELAKMGDTFHFFRHEDEPYALTSKGYTWTARANQRGLHTIMVDLEGKGTYSNDTVMGVCTDYPLLLSTQP